MYVFETKLKFVCFFSCVSERTPIPKRQFLSELSQERLKQQPQHFTAKVRLSEIKLTGCMFTDQFVILWGTSSIISLLYLHWCVVTVCHSLA